MGRDDKAGAPEAPRAAPDLGPAEAPHASGRMAALSLRDLLDLFERREIDGDQVVRRLLAAYQLEFGAAIMALRELNSAVAREAGEKLRQRIESFLAEFERPAPTSTPALPARKAEPRTSFGQRLLDKDTKVLQREYIVFHALRNPNQEIEFAKIYAGAKDFESGLTTGAMTMTLNRLVKEGLIIKRRKGRYQGRRDVSEQCQQIANEIEARDEPVPVT